MPDHPDLFAGPIESAHVRALVVPADPAPAERAKGQVLAMHEDIRKEWLDRVRKAMIQLYREREAANRERFHHALELYVCSDDASRFLEKVGYVGDTRWLANVWLQPKGLWTKVGTMPSARRHGTLVPKWMIVEAVAAEHGF